MVIGANYISHINVLTCKLDMPFVQLLKEVSTVYNIRLDILFIKVCRLIVYQADNSLGQIQADNLIKQTIGVSSRQLKMGRTVWLMSVF